VTPLTTPISFNRQQFADLLKKAIGSRSINQFALHCGVSAAYVSRLVRQVTQTPPNPPIIAKIANKAHNAVTYTQLMEAAGYLSATDEHTLRETSVPYAPDLAEILTYPALTYKGQPLDKDTRKIIEAVLEKIRIIHKEQQKL
jgi:hypothetical protein